MYERIRSLPMSSLVKLYSLKPCKHSGTGWLKILTAATTDADEDTPTIATEEEELEAGTIANASFGGIISIGASAFFFLLILLAGPSSFLAFRLQPSSPLSTSV